MKFANFKTHSFHDHRFCFSSSSFIEFADSSAALTALSVPKFVCRKFFTVTVKFRVLVLKPFSFIQVLKFPNNLRLIFDEDNSFINEFLIIFVSCYYDTFKLFDREALTALTFNNTKRTGNNLPPKK